MFLVIYLQTDFLNTHIKITDIYLQYRAHEYPNI